MVPRIIRFGCMTPKHSDDQFWALTLRSIQCQHWRLLITKSKITRKTITCTMEQFTVVFKGYFMIALALHWNALRLAENSHHCLQPKSNSIVPPFSRDFQRHFLIGSFEFLHVMWLAEMPTILLRTDKKTLVIFRTVMNILQRQEQKRPEKRTEEGQAKNTICWPPAYSHVNTGLIQLFSRCLFDTVCCLKTLVLRPAFSVG